MRPWAIAGFSGAGKSTVARLLAAAAGRRMVDLDEQIGEARVLELLAMGEPSLREAEARELVALADSGSNVVVALGGGVLEGAESRRVLEERGFVVAWLHAPLAACLARCEAQGRRRPVLDAARRSGAGALAALYESRNRAAHAAAVHAEASGPAEDVARFLLHALGDAERMP